MRRRMRPVTGCLAAAAVAAAIVIVSCGRDEGGADAALRSAGGGRVKIACAGDSITFGYGIGGRERNCYPAVLGRLLGGGYRVRNFGVNGATMCGSGVRPYRNQAEFAEAMKWDPDAVVLMLGSNDSARWDRRTADEFAADCGAMLDGFAALPSKPRLFVCLPPPIYAIRPDMPIPAIPLLKRVAEEKGATVIDLDTPLRGKAGLFPDGLHPNAEGAEIMAREVCRAIRAALPPCPGGSQGAG